MKVKDRIHLNGWPDKHGTIDTIKDTPFGKRYIVSWEDGDTTRNSIETLCLCTDRHCE